MDKPLIAKDLLKALYETFVLDGLDAPDMPCPWCLDEAFTGRIPPIGMASLWKLCDDHYAMAMEWLSDNDQSPK